MSPVTSPASRRRLLGILLAVTLVTVAVGLLVSAKAAATTSVGAAADATVSAASPSKNLAG